jgi:type IV fimbrial biogenesis protein FimT
MIGLAVLAVLASLAVPSFGALSERTRLKTVAETLAGDVAEARFEAAQRGQTLHINVLAGDGWCWTVATAPGAQCGHAQPALLKTVRSQDHAGISLLQAGGTQLQANGTALAASTLLASTHGERLRVDVSPLGRANICVAAGRIAGYRDCTAPP